MRLCHKFLLALAAVSILFVPTAGFAATDDVTALQRAIDAKNARIKDIQSRITSYTAVIDKKKLERTSLHNQVDLISNRIQKAQLDVEETSLQKDEIGLELIALDSALEDTALRIQSQEHYISSVLRDMQSLDSKNTIEILVSRESLSDYFATVQQYKQLQASLASANARLVTARNELASTRQAKEHKKETLVQLSEALTAKKESLSGQKFLKLSLIDETANSEKKFTGLVDNLRKEYEQTEGDIESMERQIRSKLNKKNSLDSLGDQNMTWPVPSHYIATYFHDPDYPYRHIFEHSGLDIRAAYGTPIHAVASGFIGRARRCTSASCYAYTLIVHQNAISSLYGHMSSITVNEGDFVARGDVIGYSGGTPGTIGAGPFVTGPHLHFEVRVNGIPVNPLTYITP